MTPPRRSNVPLLRDLDPRTVAREVCDAILDHIGQLGLALSPGVEVHVLGRRAQARALPDDADDLAALSTLGAETQALVMYAQRGLPVWDWTDHGCASDACLSVMAALYGSAGGDDAASDLDDAAREPRDAIGVVLIAARARIRLDQGTPLDSRDLATLASLTPAQVRHLMRAGEIPHAERLVAPDDAARWLSGRGVLGV